jgi:hypothetical protein
MYSDRLNKLIELALVDGELTSQEKSVLMRRAQEEGIDIDEFEMVLQAKLFQIKDSTKVVNENKEGQTQADTPNSNKHGDVKKCPSCGANVKAFNVVCEHCGHEFSNVPASSVVLELFKLLQEVERKNEAKPSSSLFGAMGQFYATNLFGAVSKADREKQSIIGNFPIPAAKSDMMEFLALAYPKALPVGNFLTRQALHNKPHNDFAPIWKSKCQQIITKGRFLFKDDKQTLEIINGYAEKLNIK